MRKEAKEFRIKKSTSNIENTQNVLKLPDCPLPQTANVKVHHTHAHSGQNFGYKAFAQPSNPPALFDNEQFKKDMSHNNINYPSQVINFFMQNDINQLSSQIMNSLNEVNNMNYNQGAGTKNPVKPKQNKHKKQASANSLNPHQRAAKRQGKKMTYSGRSSSQHSKTRQDSRSSSEQKHKHKQKSANKNRKDGYRQNSSQFKIDKKTQLNEREAEVLYINKPQHSKRTHSRMKYNQSKLFLTFARLFI